MKRTLLAACVLAPGVIVVLGGLVGLASAANGNANGQHQDYALVRLSDPLASDLPGRIGTTWIN